MGLDADIIHEWTQLISVVRKNEPRFLKQKRFPSAYTDRLQTLLARAEDECGYDESSHDEGYLSAESNRLGVLALVMEELSMVPGDHVEEAKRLAEELSDAAGNAHSAAEELAEEGPEPDYDEDEWRMHTSGVFDIAAFFSDL